MDPFSFYYIDAVKMLFVVVFLVGVVSFLRFEMFNFLFKKLRKRRKKKNKFPEEYISHSEALELTKKMRDFSVKIGVKKPESFSSKRKAQKRLDL